MPQNLSIDGAVIVTEDDARRTARIVAKSFYKIMRKNGFTTHQIIGVSTGILDCLLQSLTAHREKTRMDHSYAKEENAETGKLI